MKASKRRTSTSNRKTAILNYLARMPFASAASKIQKGIGMTRGNIYNILAKMEKRGEVKKDPVSKKYFISDGTRQALKTLDVAKPGMKIAEPELTFKPNPLIETIEKEISFIDDGIDSLRITKSYLFRRIEQLKSEDLKRARSY